MCQMSVFLARAGEEELVLENASLLEVKEDGISVSTLFEAPRLIPDARVQTIDFLNGKVILAKAGEEK